MGFGQARNSGGGLYFMKFNLDLLYDRIGKSYGQDHDTIRLANNLVFTLGVGLAFLFVLGTVALSKGNKVLAYADYSAFSCLSLLLLYLYFSKKVQATIFIGVSFTAAFYFFLLVYGGINKTAFVWYYTFPLYACFCLGSKKGFLLSLLLGILAGAYFVGDSYFPQAAQYGFDFQLRFIASYLVVSFFAFVAERLRENEQQKLQETQKILEEKVLKRTQKLTERNEELKRVSTIDSLTGIYNRLKLDEILKYEIQQAERYQGQLSLIMIDIDHFKRINDNFGHLTGDKILLQFTQVIKEGIRSVDSFGRWGGEEFMLICPSIDIENAFALAEKTRLKVQDYPFAEVGHLTASLGVTCYQRQDDEISLIKRADIALYRAKETRNSSADCSDTVSGF